MKAALLYGVGQSLRVEEYPVPKIGSDEVLVKVRAAGICGTDLHIIDGEFKLDKIPLVMGHEISGDIAGIGEMVSGFSVGDRVLVAPTGCGRCGFCIEGRDNLCESQESIGLKTDGGFAQYVCVPGSNLVMIPNGVSYDEAAISADSLATPFHAVRHLGVRVGDSIAIYGVGGLGMNAVQVAKLVGARVIAVDIFDEKLEVARELGADEVVNAKMTNAPDKVKELSGGGTDFALEVVGSKTTVEQALHSVRKGGKVGIIGGSNESFCSNIRHVLWKGLTITGCFGSLRSEFPVFLELVREGKINLKRMITHSFSLDDAQLAVKTLRERIGNPIRIVIIPNP